MSHLDSGSGLGSSLTEKTKRRCPECGEELDYLECYTGARYHYDGEFECIEMAPGRDDDYLFICPECEAELAYTIEEADEILALWRKGTTEEVKKDE
jgi:transcription initiation factor IIE alpha subunit